MAIDRFLLPFQRNTCLYISEPDIRREPVLTASPKESGAPDNLCAYFYGTVLYDESKYRMWYYAAHSGKNPDNDPPMPQTEKSTGYFSEDNGFYMGPFCYAESLDGIHFEKPALGQFSFKGTEEHNAISLIHPSIAGPLIIKDPDDPDPNRRYKMIHEIIPVQAEPEIKEYGVYSTIALAVSPDGLKWTSTQVPFPGQFMEPASFYKHGNKYVVHYHVCDGNDDDYYTEGGALSGRTGIARYTEDFETWHDFWVEAFAPTEPEDRNLRGLNGTYDQIHLGVGAASLGNVCVGLYGIWHNADYFKDFSKISGDIGLVISNDGLIFREPVKGLRFIKQEDSPCTPVTGHDLNTILTQANGILNVGDKTLIYHGRWRNGIVPDAETTQKYNGSEIALATLPRDRWGGLSIVPGASAGKVCSAEMELRDCFKVYLNADGLRNINVSLLNPDFSEIEGYANGTCREEDGLCSEVRFPLAETGKLPETVRICVNLIRNETDPRVYAVYVEE